MNWLTTFKKFTLALIFATIGVISWGQDPISLKDCEIKGLATDVTTEVRCVYNTGTFNLSFSVEYEETVLVPGTDYEVSIIHNGSPLTLSITGNVVAFTISDIDDYVITITAKEGSSTYVGEKTETLYMLNGNGTDPYQIGTTANWNTFANAVTKGYTFEGKTVEMTTTTITSGAIDGSGNITANGTMVGVWSCFSGTFDGKGNKLKFYYNATDDSGYAPFYWTDGATITDLTVEGTINASAGYVAGLIYSTTTYNVGNTKVEDVTVSVDINAENQEYCAGFAVYSMGLDFEDCIYNGQIKAGANSGGFSASYDYGGYYNGPASFTKCLFDPAVGSVITGGENFAANIDVDNSSQYYYTTPISRSKQGKKAYKGSAPADNVVKKATVEIITTDIYEHVDVVPDIEETYLLGGLPDYYDKITNCIVTFDGETVTKPTDYTVSVIKEGVEGTVTEIKTKGNYTLVIEVVEGHATYEGSYSKDFAVVDDLSGNGTSADPFIISSSADWYIFRNKINAGTDADKYYKLTHNITVSTMVGTAEHPFKGHFTAREDDTYNLYTLTFNYGSKETPTTDEIVAPFRYTDGATIEYLKVLGAIHTNVGKEAGLIGVNTKTSKKTSVYRVIVNLNFYCYEALWYAEGGGFAYDGKNITFEGCAYQGEISASNYHGGFCGNGDNTTTFTDCLFNPRGGTYWAENFVYNKSGNIDFTTCYYTEGDNQETSIQGTLVYVGTVPTETIGRKITTLYGQAIYVPVAVVISDINNTYIYTGNEITVTPSVTFDDVDAISNYYCETSIEPSIVKNVGDYTFTVTGSDYYDYAGSVTKDFRVVNSSSEGWNWLQTALSGSASTIDLEENVIYESGPSDAALTIDRTVTINLHGSTINRGLYSEVTDSGKPGGQVLRIGNGATVIINGPGTIKGGNNQAENSTEHAEFSDAGGIWNMGNLTLNNVTVEYNRCEKYTQDVSRTARGGGIYSGIGSTLKIYGGSISHNRAQGGGGGIYVEKANEFVINKADIEADTCKVHSNISQDKGGGIRVDASGKPKAVINKCSIVSNNVELHTNLSVSYGGGIHLDAGEMDLNNCEIVRNRATRYGGGIYMVKGKLNAKDCQIMYNMSYDTDKRYTGYGGGVCIMGGAYNMNGGMVYGNSSNIDNGGGIFVNTNTTLNLTGTVFVTGNWKYNDKDTDKTSTTNVYIVNKGSDGVVTVLSGFRSDSRVGVAKSDAKGWNPVFTSGLYDNSGTTSNFVSDNTKYTIVRTTVDDDPSKTSHGEAKFSQPKEWDPEEDWDDVNKKFVINDTWIIENESINIKEDEEYADYRGPITFGENGCLIIKENGILTADIETKNTNQIVLNGGQLITTSKDVSATSIKSILNAYDFGQNWYLFSTPFNNPSITMGPSGGTNLIVQDGNGVDEYDLYRFNEAATATNAQGLYLQWENYRGGGHADFNILQNGRGYLYRNENNYTAVTRGTLNDADINYTLSYTGLNELKGFHAIGNPFSHNIYKNDLYQEEGTKPAINDAHLAVGYYRLVRGTGIEEDSWVPYNGYEHPIEPMEGVLVQVVLPSEQTSTVLTITKTTNPAAEYPVPDPEPGEKGKAGYESLAFEVSNSTSSDMAYAMFCDGIGLNKIGHLGERTPMLYISQNDKNYAIATMSDDVKAFNLNFEAKTFGRYTLSVKPEGEFGYLHLYDKLTDEDIDLLKESEYEFVGSTADGADRFVVRLDPSTPSTGSGTEVFVWQSGNDIIVEGNGELQVFDVMGRLVSTQYVNGVETMCTSSLQTGVYVFRLNEQAQKIVIR